MYAPSVHQKIKDAFGERILQFEEKALQPFVVVAPKAIAEVAAFCKSDPDLLFDNLM